MLEFNPIDIYTAPKVVGMKCINPESGLLGVIVRESNATHCTLFSESSTMLMVIYCNLKDSVQGHRPAQGATIIWGLYIYD